MPCRPCRSKIQSVARSTMVLQNVYAVAKVVYAIDKRPSGLTRHLSVEARRSEQRQSSPSQMWRSMDAPVFGSVSFERKTPRFSGVEVPYRSEATTLTAMKMKIQSCLVAFEVTAALILFILDYCKSLLFGIHIQSSSTAIFDIQLEETSRPGWRISGVH